MGNGPYDVFGSDWGLGLPIEWFDADGIEALLTGALTGASQIDQLVIGWDGEPADVWETIRMMLRARGYFPGYNAEGEITFARARLANVLDIGGTVVAPIPHTLREEPAEGDGIDRIVATYAKTPWFEGDRIEVNAFSDSDALEPPNSLRAGIFANKNAIELDMSVIAPIDLESAGYDLVSYVAMRGLGLPTLYIRANDPGTIALGDIVRVGDPKLRKAWFVDADGNDIEVTDTSRWYGQVVGFRRQLLDGSIDLELKMNPNEFGRLRAPSAIVASVAGAVYTCDENVFKGPFGGGTDVEQFTVGDKVELWTPDGSRRSGTAASPDVQEITAIGTNTLTLDAAFTTAATANDVIRLAHLSTATGYPEDGGDLVDGVLAYVYGADDARTIGPNDDPAHIYGYGVL
jgi:hypothetical protein